MAHLSEKNKSTAKETEEFRLQIPLLVQDSEMLLLGPYDMPDTSPLLIPSMPTTTT